MLPGNVDFIGRMYAFGAMLSFTIAHAAVIQLRRKPPPVEDPYRVGPNLKIGRVSWPLFAVFGGIGTGLAWLVVVVEDPATRYAGLAWLAAGFVFYTVYRRRLGIPLRETVLAPLQFGPAMALEYRTILVPIVSGAESHEAIDLAARLAAERGATIVALRVIVVPMDTAARHGDARRGGRGRPAPRRCPARGRVLRRAARSTASSARASPAGRSSRRRAGARPRSSSSARRAAAHKAIFGKTVDYVLKNAPCRVMVAAGKKAA